jgi:hypothetical protein
MRTVGVIFQQHWTANARWHFRRVGPAP